MVIILGIVSMTAVPLFNQALTHSRIDAAADAVATALNYARVSALTSQRQFLVKFDASANSVEVLRYNYHRLNRLQDTGDMFITGYDVDYDYRWETAAHPVNDAGLSDSDQAGYLVDFDSDQMYKGADITAATFGGTSTVTFSTAGLPNNGGTVTIQLGGLQRQVTVNAGTGAVSTG